MARSPETLDDHFAFQIHLNPTTVFRFLIGVIALLLVVSLTFTTIVYVFEPPGMPPWHFWPFLVNLEETHNIPGWYGVSLMLLCGVSMLGIGIGYIQTGRRWFGIGWWWLAGGFLYLSLDAAVTQLNIEQSLTTSSGSPFVWLAPVVFLIGLLPFLRALPPETTRGLVFAAIVLGFGAVVLDMVADGLHTEEARPMSSRVVSNLEEAMEMFGVAMFIRVALDYIAVHCRDIRVRTPVMDRRLRRSI